MQVQLKFAAVALVIALAGCSTQPIQNVDQAAVTNAAGKPLTREQVRSSIVRAGAALGWQIADETPNRLVGTIQLRKHTAIVEIPYSAAGYAIEYRSSTNLDEKDGKIHKNYNGWIQNLHRGINAQLSAS
jgi:hypothetical protein